MDPSASASYGTGPALLWIGSEQRPHFHFHGAHSLKPRRGSIVPRCQSSESFPGQARAWGGSLLTDPGRTPHPDLTPGQRLAGHRSLPSEKVKQAGLRAGPAWAWGAKPVGPAGGGVQSPSRSSLLRAASAEELAVQSRVPRPGRQRWDPVTAGLGLRTCRHTWLPSGRTLGAWRSCVTCGRGG